MARCDRLGERIPSHGCIEANAQVLARYAALCQEDGLVPIVEPEVLMDGDHSMERCREATNKVLLRVFTHLRTQRVLLGGVLLKPNMVLPGLKHPKQAPVDEAADATIKCLLQVVPAAVPAIAFLSGGQSPELASARLNAMHVGFKTLPWAVTFSFSRAIQEPALKLWRGEDANIAAAQKALSIALAATEPRRAASIRPPWSADSCPARRNHPFGSFSSGTAKPSGRCRADIPAARTLR